MVTALGDELMAQIAAAFREVRYPGDAAIICHPCEECFDLQRDFSGQVPRTMSRNIIEKHSLDLSLFTDDAKQFFLPAYLFASLRQPQSPVTDFLIDHLGSDHRWDPAGGYTREQKSAILAHLDLMETLREGQFVEAIGDARRQWTTST